MINDSTQRDLSRPPFDAYKGNLPYIFVSYSHKDSSMVFKEIVRLYHAGYRIWYDEGIDPGNEWPDEVALALEKSSFFIVFVSLNSIISQNVKNEINFALNKHKPFLAIYINETELPSGLMLRMGDIQAIFRYKMDENTFTKKIYRSLPEKLIDAGQIVIPPLESKKPIEHPINEPLPPKVIPVNDAILNPPVNYGIREEQVLTLIKNMDYKIVSWSGSMPGAPGGSKLSDNNSRFIFEEISKITSENELKEILYNILEKHSNDSIIKWKTIVILRYFKDIVALTKFSELIFKANKNDTYYFNDILSYIEIVYSIKTANTVKELLFKFVKICPSESARSKAFKSLIDKINIMNSDEINNVMNLIKNETSSSVRSNALDAFNRFDLRVYKEDILELAQDQESNLRKKVVELINSNNIQFDLEIFISLFEIESIDDIKMKIGSIMLSQYKSQAIEYLSKYLKCNDEKFLMRLIELFKQNKISEPINQISVLLGNNNLSESLKKSVESYITSFKS